MGGISIFDKFRMPTLLGLGLIFTALFLGLAIYIYNHELSKKVLESFKPRDLQVVNITDSSAAIVWETAVDTSGSVIIESKSQVTPFLDSRDKNPSALSYIHFYELKSLLPNTTYSFKVKSGTLTFKEKDFKFTTAKEPNADLSTNKPVTGKVVETNLSPTKEALVFLKIPGANMQATYVSLAGNFLIPLTFLKTSDLSKNFEIKGEVLSELEIKRGNLSSIVKMTLPQEQVSTPPIILGQNADFTQLKEIQPQASPNPKTKYDLNHDGKINSVDLSIVVQNLGKKGDNPADLNSDKVVDQKDVDIIKSKLE